jgi:hypothetical protein
VAVFVSGIEQEATEKTEKRTLFPPFAPVKKLPDFGYGFC